MASATPSRRMGAPDSKTRAQLLDAAEALLLEEGYAAVTSRKVAARAGLKPQLVHYYFRTMEDLYVEVFRRNAEASLARFERAVAVEPTLPALWQLHVDPRGAAFTMEFVALANHHKSIRAEVAAFAGRFRTAQLAAFEAALEHHGIREDELPPIVALLLVTGLSQIMAIETTLGVTVGHDTTVAFVERTIAELVSRSDGNP